MTGSRLVFLWLLVPSIAAAAPAARSGLARVCSPHPITLHKLARTVRHITGPVAEPARHTLPGLKTGASRIERGGRLAASDDGAAIQNDAPAAWLDGDGILAFALEPVGELARSGRRSPHTHDCSPRSPRAPPVAV